MKAFIVVYSDPRVKFLCGWGGGGGGHCIYITQSIRCAHFTVVDQRPIEKCILLGMAANIPISINKEAALLIRNPLGGGGGGGSPSVT